MSTLSNPIRTSCQELTSIRRLCELGLAPSVLPAHLDRPKAVNAERDRTVGRSEQLARVMLASHHRLREHVIPKPAAPPPRPQLALDFSAGSRDLGRLEVEAEIRREGRGQLRRGHRGDCASWCGDPARRRARPPPDGSRGGGARRAGARRLGACPTARARAGAGRGCER